MRSTMERQPDTGEAVRFRISEIDKPAAHQSKSGVGAREGLIRELSSWTGVEAHDHRFGGVEFRVGRREIGHIHETIADLPFPRAVRDELIAAGLARPHHVLPDSGWVTVPMRTDREVANVIQLFRHNYERATKARLPSK